MPIPVSRPPCTVVHLVRHAEVDNPDGVLYGRAAGFGLTPRGEAMALALADWFATRDVAAVWTSPLLRARRTAAPLADRLGLEARVDDRLLEASSTLEGTRATLSRSVLAQPHVWPHVWNPLRPSWGEPYALVAARMWAAVEELRPAAACREVVLVSHQMPIWVVRRRAQRQRLAHHPRRRECALASVTSLRFAGDTLAQVDYRDTPPEA